MTLKDVLFILFALSVCIVAGSMIAFYITEWFDE